MHAVVGLAAATSIGTQNSMPEFIIWQKEIKCHRTSSEKKMITHRRFFLMEVDRPHFHSMEHRRLIVQYELDQSMLSVHFFFVLLH